MARQDAEALRAAAQDRGIAGLQAQRAGVGGDVGPALEDDADRRRAASRTRSIRRPFGRVHSASTAPTGSGSAAMSSTPSAMASMRAGVERQPVDEGAGRRRPRAARGRWRWRRGSRLRRARMRVPPSQQRGVLRSARRARERRARRPAARAAIACIARRISVGVSCSLCAIVARPFRPAHRRGAIAVGRWPGCQPAEPITRSSRWIISARPRKPRMASISLRRAPGDPRGIGRRHRRRGRGRSRAPSGSRITTASPRAKLPSTRMTPAGSRLLPARSAATAPASTMQRARAARASRRSSVLRAVTGLAGVRNQVQRAAVGDRAQRMLRPCPTR